MNRDGFTLIEVMIGMLVFVVGALALASTTGYVSLQLQSTDIRTERSVARQQVIEQLHAVEFDNLLPVAKGDGPTVSGYTLWWEVDEIQWALKEVRVIAEGPGFRDGRRRTGIVDTLTVRVARPVQ